MSYNSLHLEENENVVFEVRKHWIVFLGQAFLSLFSLILPIVIFFLINWYVPELLNIDWKGNRSALFLFFYCLWFLFIWILFFIEWTKYYLDVWYITERRIILVDQKNIFHREVSNIKFQKIQDVTLETRGFLASFLGFGDIRVQTASENSQEFFMKAVRHPEEVRRIVFSHQNKNDNHHFVNNI